MSSVVLRGHERGQRKRRRWQTDPPGRLWHADVSLRTQGSFCAFSLLHEATVVPVPGIVITRTAHEVAARDRIARYVVLGGGAEAPARSRRAPALRLGRPVCGWSRFSLPSPLVPCRAGRMQEKQTGGPRYRATPGQLGLNEGEEDRGPT